MALLTSAALKMRLFWRGLSTAPRNVSSTVISRLGTLTAAMAREKASVGVVSRDLGHFHYAHEFKKSLSLTEMRKRYGKLSSGQVHGDMLSIAGSIMNQREITDDKTCYTLLAEGIEVAVVSSGSELVENFGEYSNQLQRGDIIGVTGSPFKTEHGELQIISKKLTLLAPCLHELPGEEWSSIKDVEKRHAQRYLDLIINRDTRERLITRSQIVSFTREFLSKMGFVEVETPIMNKVAGGASSQPFNIYQNHIDTEFVMRMSPELYLKKLLVGGIERIFEIGKQFRYEVADQTHRSEFTSCELYMSYADYNDLMAIIERYLSELVIEIKGTYKIRCYFDTDKVVEVDFTPPFKRISVVEELERQLRVKFPSPTSPEFQQFLDDQCTEHSVDCSPPRTSSRLFDKLVKKFVEIQCKNPTFLMDHPTIVGPLCKEHRLKPGLAEKFELLVCGTEIVDGTSDLNNPVELRKQFEQWMLNRAMEDNETQRVNESFLLALEYGCPPSVGCGLGIDRLCMILTTSPNIEEVMCFPRH